MARDPNSHLSSEELAWLADEADSIAETRDRSLELAQAEAHSRVCSECGLRLRAEREVRAKLFRLGSQAVSFRRADCPEEQRWAEVAAGTLPEAEARVLLQHASSCDHCGPLLRETTEDLNPEISAEDQELIGRLPSAKRDWQANLARRMAGVQENLQQSHETQAVQIRPSRRPTFSWLRWAVPAAAVFAVAALGVMTWMQRSPSLSSTNQLIAEAYTEQRPFEWRFPDARYGPVRQRRGAQDSRMDESPALLEAESSIASALAKHPDDPGWLQAKARTELLEGNYDSAIDALTRAQSSSPGDESLQLDLAIAYCARAGGLSDKSSQSADYGRALQLLNQILVRQPNNTVALFNRAVVYAKEDHGPEAIADWKQYLQIDPTGAWAEDAKQQLGARR